MKNFFKTNKIKTNHVWSRWCFYFEKLSLQCCPVATRSHCVLLSVCLCAAARPTVHCDITHTYVDTWSDNMWEAPPPPPCAPPSASQRLIDLLIQTPLWCFTICSLSSRFCTHDFYFLSVRHENGSSLCFNDSCAGFYWSDSCWTCLFCCRCSEVNRVSAVQNPLGQFM